MRGWALPFLPGRGGAAWQSEPSLNSSFPNPTAGSVKEPWYERASIHALAMVSLAAHMLVVSWRKWPDAIVDFGRELYLPWRISEGAVLYRDVDNFYGPFSQYFNGVLFHFLGSGMMVLVWANLAIFAAIVAVMYFLLRKAWGPLAAMLGGSTLIVVFGFGRLSRTGSFNYLTPYAHEATHGILVLVLLVAVAARWLSRPTLYCSASMGLLAGLALVLKAEIILAAGLVCALAFGLRMAASERLRRRWLLAFGVGALLPTAAFMLYFSRHLPLADALAAATRAWMNLIVSPDYVAEPAQLKFAGLDRPGLNFLKHLGAVAIALAVAGGFVLLGRGLSRLRSGWPLLLTGAGIATLVAVVSWWLPALVWGNAGRCLLGLLVAYLFLVALRARRMGLATVAGNPVATLRVLLAVVGAAMMVRMILNGRIHQFGFYQAALATLVVLAALVGEFPRRVCVSVSARRWLQAAAVALVLPGVAAMGWQSIKNYRKITLPLGEGRDQFYSWQGMRVFQGVEHYLRENGRGEALVALPEGLMLNYLARMPSPVGTIYSAVTDVQRETSLVKRLEARPPGWVVVVPRDLGEYGVARYGERSGAGRDLLQWVARDYVEAGSLQPVTIQPGVMYLFRKRESVDVASR